MTIFNLGSINLDHVYQVPHFVAPGETLSSNGYQLILGGKGANQSIAISKAGAHVVHVGSLHNNDAPLLQTLSEFGVDCSDVSLGTVPSGHAIIQVVPEGENSIVLFGGANQAINSQAIESVINRAQSHDWFLTQNETNLVPESLALAKSKGLMTVYNPAPANGIESLVSPKSVDVLIANQTEAEAITGLSELNSQIAYFSREWPASAVIITLGSKGAIILLDGNVASVDAFKVTPVDTTAAGDTFIGYLLAQLIKLTNIDMLALQSAAKVASAASALTVQKHGASSSIPSADEVEQFLTKEVI